VSVIFVVLPLALVIVGAALWGYIWAAKQGQFDDLDTPAMRMLRDEEHRGGERGGEESQRDTAERG
jgi:cbb3-type cytochrome oxidase maturation protein